MEGRPPNTKAKLTEVNTYLTCYLCKGYYIDATTIVECLHSFCRSCIIQHLQVNSYCPICELMINTAKPNIKPDKTLQDIVYKLVPGLYASEMCRRRLFWAKHPEEAQKVSCPEARGQMTERIIFSPQDAISLSIEYTSDDQPDWPRNRNQPVEGGGGGEPDPEVPLRRYLQCPAMLRVEHLKKFICNKYNVDIQHYHVDILHKRVPLPDHYTLMDIAYIYSWKRNEPMKFFFRITDINLVSERFDYFEPSSAAVESTPVRYQRSHKQTTSNNNNNNNYSNSDKKPQVQNVENKFGDNKTVDKINSEKKPQFQNVENKCSDNKTVLKNSKNLDKRSDRKGGSSEKSDKKIKSAVDDKTCENKNTNDGVKHSAGSNKIETSESESLNVNPKKDQQDKVDDKNNVNIVDNKKSDIHKSVSGNSEINQSKSVQNNPTNCSQERFTSDLSEKVNSDLKLGINVTDKSNEDLISSKLSYGSENLKPSSVTDSKVPSSSLEILKSEPEVQNFDQTSVGKDLLKTLVKTEVKLEGNDNKPQAITVLDENPEDVLKKSQFLNSIQLTAKNTSPPTRKVEIPDPKPKVAGQKRKYVRKTEKSPTSAKKMKLSAESKTKPTETQLNKLKLENSLNKVKKTILKDSDPTENDGLKVRNIKNPIVRLMMSNLNKQATNVSKIVGQTECTKVSPGSPQTQNERLQSLIDSCKLNIPSSLSITLTESTRNEDGTIVETKPAPMKPVQNYIEILKLPDVTPGTNGTSQSMKNLIDKLANCSDSSVEALRKTDSLKAETAPGEKGDTSKNADNKNGVQNSVSSTANTFQAMFEETIKRNECIKAQLLEIQNQAKNAELAKKAASCVRLVPHKSGKKLQNNALDLSSKTSPKSGINTGNVNGTDLKLVADPKLTPGTDTKQVAGADPKFSAGIEVRQSTTPDSKVFTGTNPKVGTASELDRTPKMVNTSNIYGSTTPASNSQGANIPNLNPIPQNSFPSSKTPPSSISPNTSSSTKTTHSQNHSHKRNILEIAHELSKRSKLDSESSASAKVLTNPRSKLDGESSSAVKIPTNTTSPPKLNSKSPNPKSKEGEKKSPPKHIIINNHFTSGGSMSINNSPKKPVQPPPNQKIPIPRLPVSKVPIPKLNPSGIRNGNLMKFSNYTAKLAMGSNPNSASSPAMNNSTKVANSTTKPEPTTPTTIHGMSPNQILEKYNITNLAQFNANLNQAQLAFQQALMMSHQLEMHRLQQNNQKHWINNPNNILAHYESYVQSLKNQQNQMCGSGSKN